MIYYFRWNIFKQLDYLPEQKQTHCHCCFSIIEVLFQWEGDPFRWDSNSEKEERFLGFLLADTHENERVGTGYKWRQNMTIFPQRL